LIEEVVGISLCKISTGNYRHLITGTCFLKKQKPYFKGTLRYLPSVVVGHEATDLSECEWPAVVGLREARHHADAMLLQIAGIKLASVNSNHPPYDKYNCYTMNTMLLHIAGIKLASVNSIHPPYDKYNCYRIL
jgi:hypothetical protein